MAVCSLLATSQAWFSTPALSGSLNPGDAPAPPVISADEPKSALFSAEQAARYLDLATLHWQRTHQCGTCHTNFAYLMARPALRAVLPTPPEPRTFFEEMVEKRWPEHGPRWDAEVVVAAVSLAFNDRFSSGKLHSTTRKALDRMWTLQRADGGWSWLKCGWPPAESDDHYGVTFAAIGAGIAPDNYAITPAAQRGLEGIRRYLKANPAPSLHHEAMILWASLHVDGLMTNERRRSTIDRLLALQRPDGGWATATLFDGWTEHKRKDQKPQQTAHADGYGTGFIIYLARSAGVDANDLRLRRGINWLRTNQRESGRWFTPSPTKDSKHYITNFGTAFAVLALEANGELPTRVTGKN
jgi:squalene-hopene/tetraprenyl-beta-curcumene cyclase